MEMRQTWRAVCIKSLLHPVVSPSMSSLVEYRISDDLEIDCRLYFSDLSIMYHRPPHALQFYPDRRAAAVRPHLEDGERPQNSSKIAALARISRFQRSALRIPDIAFRRPNVDTDAL